MPSEIKPPMPTPTAYLSEAVSGQATKASGRSGVLYYPGSGTDSGPFHLFAENANVETVIYADYSITQDEARKFLNSFSLRGWKLDEGGVECLEPASFHTNAWEEFWPEAPESRRQFGPESAFGLRAKLTCSERQVEFIFLATEAIQTFSILAGSRLQPTIVILQDHGFGDGWASFGGENSILFGQALNVGLPQLLLVARNTHAWPGFGQVSKYAVQAGQMHNQPRAIFRLQGQPAT